MIETAREFPHFSSSREPPEFLPVTQPSPTPPLSLAELHDRISQPTPAVVDVIAKCPGSISVLGAGGKMGLHLCQTLQRAINETGRTDRVLAVSRFGSEATRREFERAGCDSLPTDLSDPSQVAELPDVDNVFMLAGIKFGSSQHPNSLQQMNVDMPTLVVQRFPRARFVVLSTGCVYSFTSPESGGSTETSPTQPPGDYACSCLGREQVFAQAAAAHGTRSSIIRLNYSVDLRYGVLVDIAQKVRIGAPIDQQTGYVNVIWQGDAISHIIQSLTLATAPPQLLNVTGADILRVRDIAAAFSDRFGIDAHLTGTESSTAWLNNPSLSHKLFGAPLVSVECMIDWIAAWLERGNPTLDKPTHFEVRDGEY